MKTALITGITGQVGSYLAQFLLGQGYKVHGIIRRSSSFNTGRINHIFDQLNLHYGDLTDGLSLRNIINTVAPHEIYHLAAQSHVKVSFDQPVYTVDVIAKGVMNLLDAIRDTGATCRFYNAATSEMFGKVIETPQTELTPFYPRSPYACAKIFSYYQTINYRESYNMHCCNGIMFNCESPERGETFVTRKITRAATRIKLGLQDKLVLGNLDASRDWGYAGDYVEAIWKILQAPKPDDFIIATGKTHTIREFLTEAFEYLDLDWEKYVTIDDKYLRPAEVDLLLGDATKAKTLLNWAPKVTFKELVRLMVDSDYKKGTHELRNI